MKIYRYFSISSFLFSCVMLLGCSHAPSAEITHTPVAPATTSAAPTETSNTQSASILNQTPTTANTADDDLVAKRAEKIALLLPTTGPLSGAAQAIVDGFIAAQNQDEQRTQTKATVQVYNTTSEPIENVYQSAVAQGATVVVGPLEKEQVAALKTLHHFPVPILALNYLTDSSTDKNRDKGYFFQFGLAAEDEALQVADQAFLEGYQSVAVLYPDNEWGNRISQTFIQRWQAQKGQVVAALAFSDPEKVAPDIKRLLAPKTKSDKRNAQRRTDIDFIFLLATPDQARQIKPILNFYYADNIPVYATSSIYSGVTDPSRDRDLNKIFFVDQPWLLEDDDAMKKYAQTNWPNQYGQTARLRGLGIDAYRLQDQLSLFSSSAHAMVQGVTGQLTTDRSLKIRRRLSWAQFNNGVADLISSSSEIPAPFNQ